MRAVLGFFSLMAFAVLGLGVLAVVASGTLPHIPFGNGAGGDLDTASALVGLAAGVVLSALARVSWSELPRRTVAWLMANERNFARLAWGLLFIGILFFY